MSHVDYCKQFLNKNSLILDIGSGRGKFLCEMAKLGFRVFGIEINPDYIKESNKRATEENVYISVIQSKAESLPFINNNFDFINCAEVTEHVDNPKLAYEEIFRVLKLGGKCYISFHNRWGIYDYHYHLYFINWLPRILAKKILKLLKKQKDDSMTGRQKLETMHYFTYNRIKKILENIGFSVKDIREEKIRNRFKYNFLPFLALYFVLRPFYFSTFHLLLKK